MTGYFALDPRPLTAADHGSARVLLLGAFGVTPYVDRAFEVLERAERGGDPEHRALIIERDGTVGAIALYGNVAGAEAVMKIHVAALAPGLGTRDVGARLFDATVARAREERVRLLVAEVPDDPAMSPLRALLAAGGFEEECRVPDYFRDGVALSLLRRDL